MRLFQLLGVSAVVGLSPACDVSIDGVPARDAAAPSVDGGSNPPPRVDGSPGGGAPDAGAPVQGSVTLELDDAFVDSAAPDTNFDTALLEIDGDPSEKYALIKPRDLGAIPPGSTVERATLVVTNNDGGDIFAVHELTGAFTESAVTFATAPGRLAPFATVPGTIGVHSIDVTAVVQGWVDGAAAHGLALHMVLDNGVDLHSSEAAVEAERPRLVVDFRSDRDACPDDPDKDAPGACGCGVPEGSCGGAIAHLGTTEVWDADGVDVRIARPAGSQPGDVLVLFLHRTDDDLPLEVDGWTRVAECFKGGNGDQCATAADCVRRHNAAFCADFGANGGGHDLAQAAFVRTVAAGEPSEYTFDLDFEPPGHPGWAILSALRGVNAADPVRATAGTGCDRSDDSVFPSVLGEAGDMLLLSQSFDDAIAQDRFLAPDGTSALGYVSNSDEAGFLFGGTLAATGETGPTVTRGEGGPACKDALLSLTIRPQ